MVTWKGRKNHTEARQLTVAQAAYIAGFIDGEGCVSIIRRKRSTAKPGASGYYFRPRVAIAQRDIAPLHFIQNVVGTGFTVEPVTSKKWVGYQLRWESGALRWLLPQIAPYLVLKKRQAHLLMAFIDLGNSYKPGSGLTPERYAVQAEMYNESRRLNQKPKCREECQPVESVPLTLVS